MVEKRIKSMVATKFNIDESKVKFDTHFFNDLGADSLEMLSFITALEKEFNVEVQEQHVDKLHSVKMIMEFLESAS